MMSLYNKDIVTKQNITYSNVLLDFKTYQNEYLNFFYIRRFNYFNVYQVPALKTLGFQFKSFNLSTTLNLSLIANFFFLRFFTGKKPFFLPVKIVSTFKKKIYHCTCVLNLAKKESIALLGTHLSFASEALSIIDFYPFPKIFEKKKNYLFLMKNFNYINVVETHPVFFKWQENLEVTVFFNKELSRLEYILFFKFLKFNENKFLL